jgi:hypothetical protein
MVLLYNVILIKVEVQKPCNSYEDRLPKAACKAWPKDVHLRVSWNNVGTTGKTMS